MRRALPLSACLLMALAVPASAPAKKGKKAPKLGPVVTVSATSAVPGPTDPGATATATCPKGTMVFGGGFSAPYEDPVGMVVHESRRSGPRTWTVSAHRINDPGAVTAEAYCRRAKRRSITTFAETSVAPAGSVGAATGSCPVKQTLVGGGFGSTVGSGSDDLVLVQTSNPRISSWLVRGRNVASVPLTLTAEAYCMRPGTKNRRPVGIESGSASQTERISAASGPCPKPKRKGRKKTRRTRLAAGGFILYTAAAPGVIPFATDSLRTPQGWLTSALSATNTAGFLRVTSRGLCA